MPGCVLERQHQHPRGVEPRPLAFPVHSVSKVAALTLTGCPLFLPRLRKGGIKGPLAPIPGVELTGRGPSPPGLGKTLHRLVSR